MATESTPRPTRSSSGASVAIAVAFAALAVPLAVVLGIVGLVLPVLTWWIGVLVALIVAAAVLWWRLRNAGTAILRTLGAQLIEPEEQARFANLVQGLALSGATDEPDIYVIDDAGRNAAAVVGGEVNAIVATTGLLSAVDRIGLEGIVAEALVRIESGDAEAATKATALFGPLMVGPAASVARPVVSFGVQNLLQSDRDLLADQAAVSLTRYPPGLLAALDAIRAGTPATAVNSEATDHLWLVPPGTADHVASAIVPGAPLELRMDVLGEL
ncbi:MAG: hypothetical protein AAF467_17410 [Actinomycetota bacterium]